MFSRLTFLGTGAGMPSPARNVSAFALSFADGSAWLFDCGEGTQQQLMRCCGAAGQEASKRIGGEAPAGLSISRIKRIFITHLHGDHCLGLPGLVMTLAALRVRASAGLPPEGEGGGGSCEQQEQGPPAFAPFSEEAEYLEIVGPLGLARLLRGVLSSTDTGVLGFRYRVTELCDPPLGEAPRGEEALHASEAPVLSLLPDANGIYTIAVEPCGAAIRAAKLQHRVLCFGFAITEVTRPGALDAAKAMALGAKGPALGLLKAGKACVCYNSIILRRSYYFQFLNPPTPHSSSSSFSPLLQGNPG
jgi:ribonuclease Z